MNSFQSFNLSATIAILLLVPVGLHENFNEYSSTVAYLTQNVEAVVLAAFMVLFKLKSHLDDHQYFGEIEDNKAGAIRYTEFAIGTISWIVFGLAAIDAAEPKRAAELLIVAFLISTLWVFVHLTQMYQLPRSSEQGSAVKRLSWVLFNIGYVLALLGFILSSAEYHWVSLLLLMALLTIDIIFSKSFSSGAT